MSRRVEEDIKETVYDAYRVAKAEIGRLQEVALERGELLLEQPEFIQFARKEFLEGQEWNNRTYLPVRNNVGLDLTFLHKGTPGKLGKTILQLEVEKGLKPLLMAGAILSIKDEDGEIIGGLIGGYSLAQKFEQNISRYTGVAVRVIWQVSPEEIRDVKFSPKAEEEIFQKHSRYYDKGATLKGKPYAVLCKPFMGEKEMLGLMLIGIPKTYAFQTVLGQYLPFLIGIWIVVAAALGYVVTRGIANPISRFIKGAKAIASGDLSQHVEVNSRDEIGKLADAFNHMAQELRGMREVEEQLRKLERLSALGELAAGVAHEVRNPLGIIKNSAQILQKNSLDEKKRKEVTKFIVEETNRINKVVSNFLDCARPPKPHRQKVSLNNLIDRMLQLASDEVRKNNIEVVKEYDHSLARVSLDPSQFQQLFLNLLLNSIQAMPQGGELKVNTGEEDGQVKIVFSDTGKGIPPEIRGKIFDPFFTTRKEGSGLGLSIVHKVVENHQGKIEVDSKKGQSTTFTIWLPRE